MEEDIDERSLLRWRLARGAEQSRLREHARDFAILWHRYSNVREAGGPHNLPHFHAYYQDDVGIYGLDPIEKLAGSLPKRQERLVLAWAELHQEELVANWNELQAGRPPSKIEALK